MFSVYLGKRGRQKERDLRNKFVVLFVYVYKEMGGAEGMNTALI
jgi:hypothetical protein